MTLVYEERVPRPAQLLGPWQGASLDGSNVIDLATNGAFLSDCIIVEIFAGSARVTASLKQLSRTSSFGVDKFRSKNAVSAIAIADLTTSEGEDLLMSWLQIPNVVGIFLAPPCGSASRARQIPLEKRFGRKQRATTSSDR